MDFRSEIERHDNTVQNKVDQQLQEIHDLQKALVTMEDKITNLKTEITSLKPFFAPQIQELTEKKELLAQLQSILAEHENSLLANQMLIEMQALIEKNQAQITQRLTELEKEKALIGENIDQFHNRHPNLGVESEARLKNELDAKQRQLLEVSEKITQIEAMQSSLNIIAKIILNLLYSWGWRTDPLAKEQEKLLQIAGDIIQINHNLQEHHSHLNTLETLHQQHEQISTEKIQLVQDQGKIEQIDATKKAIAESQQTIKKIGIQITNTRSECKTLQNKIRILDKKISEHQALIDEKDEMLKKLKEKSEGLAEIDNPRRVALKTILSDKLKQIITHQETYIHDQEIYRTTHSTTHFFKPVAGRPLQNQASHDTPNFVALSTLQAAINTYKNGLPKDTSEYRLMSQIVTKLLLWQMAESMANTQMTMEARQTAHHNVNTEIAALVADLPIDNPLHAGLHFMEALTRPLEPSEEASSRNTKRMR